MLVPPPAAAPVLTTAAGLRHLFELLKKKSTHHALNYSNLNYMQTERYIQLCRQGKKSFLPEICQLYDPIVSDQAVGALNVSMCDAIAMEIFQADQQLLGVRLGDGLFQVSELINECLLTQEYQLDGCSVCMHVCIYVCTVCM